MREPMRWRKSLDQGENPISSASLLDRENPFLRDRKSVVEEKSVDLSLRSIDNPVPSVSPLRSENSIPSASLRRWREPFNKRKPYIAQELNTKRKPWEMREPCGARKPSETREPVPLRKPSEMREPLDAARALY